MRGGAGGMGAAAAASAAAVGQMSGLSSSADKAASAVATAAAAMQFPLLGDDIDCARASERMICSCQSNGTLQCAPRQSKHEFTDAMTCG